MSPEYNYHLTINAKNSRGADRIKNLLELIQGIKIMPADSDVVESESTLNLSTPMSEVIQSWRQSRGLNKTDLATIVAKGLGRKVSTVKAYLSKLENDNITNPGTDYRRSLATALQIPELYLVTHQLPLPQEPTLASEMS